MTGPLAGIRVVEVANWLAAPSSAALMADLGADVIKVEPPGGDVFRGLDGGPYPFQLDNRGKRSVTVALDRPGGPELVHRLSSRADIFVTNVLHHRKERHRLTFEDIRAASPSVVYVSFSGYGHRGPLARRPGFDFSAFWASSGIMSTIASDVDAAPALCRSGQGDHTTALNLLAATLAALRLRDQSGEAQHVEVTLQGTGIWTIGAEVSTALVDHQQPAPHDRRRPDSPVWNHYECRDGRWLFMAVLVPEPYYWPAFCEALGHPERAKDARYDTIEHRAEHSAEITSAIAEVFKSEDLAYWTRRLDEFGLVWSPVNDVPTMISDPQPREMDAFVTLHDDELGNFETLNTPFQIYGADIGPRRAAPSPGEHTLDVLGEYGIAGEELDRLAIDGVIG